MGKLISASYPLDQKLDNLVNSLLPNEANLPTDMVFDMIPNVGILKALWTAQSDLMPVYTNKSQEQILFYISIIRCEIPLVWAGRSTAFEERFA
jgi:hypothetical protein